MNDWRKNLPAIWEAWPLTYVCNELEGVEFGDLDAFDFDQFGGVEIVPKEQVEQVEQVEPVKTRSLPVRRTTYIGRCGSCKNKGTMKCESGHVTCKTCCKFGIEKISEPIVMNRVECFSAGCQSIYKRQDIATVLSSNMLFKDGRVGL